MLLNKFRISGTTPIMYIFHFVLRTFEYFLFYVNKVRFPLVSDFVHNGLRTFRVYYKLKTRQEYPDSRFLQRI